MPTPVKYKNPFRNEHHSKRKLNFLISFLDVIISPMIRHWSLFYHQRSLLSRNNHVFLMQVQLVENQMQLHSKFHHRIHPRPKLKTIRQIFLCENSHFPNSILWRLKLFVFIWFHIRLCNIVYAHLFWVSTRSDFLIRAISATDFSELEPGIDGFLYRVPGGL